MSASGTHNPPEFKHAEDMEWEMGRFGNVTKFLFHPRPERPTEPNAGISQICAGRLFSRCTGTISLRSGTSSSEFTFAGKLYGPGTIAYMADPAFRACECTRRPAGRSFSCNTRSDDRHPADL